MGPGPPLALQQAWVLLAITAQTENQEIGHLLCWPMLAPTGVCLNKYLILSRKYRGVCVHVSVLNYTQQWEYSRAWAFVSSPPLGLAPTRLRLTRQLLRRDL